MDPGRDRVTTTPRQQSSTDQLTTDPGYFMVRAGVGAGGGGGEACSRKENCWSRKRAMIYRLVLATLAVFACAGVAVAQRHTAFDDNSDSVAAIGNKPHVPGSL